MFTKLHMTFEVTNKEVSRLENTKWYISQEEDSDGGNDINPTSCADYGNGDYVCLGAYSISVFLLTEDGSPAHHPVTWDSRDARKFNRPQYKLHIRLLNFLSREVTKSV